MVLAPGIWCGHVFPREWVCMFDEFLYNVATFRFALPFPQCHTSIFSRAVGRPKFLCFGRAARLPFVLLLVLGSCSVSVADKLLS